MKIHELEPWKLQALLLSTIAAWEERNMLQSPTPNNESLSIQINDSPTYIGALLCLQ